MSFNKLATIPIIILGACGGPARPRLSEMKSTLEGSGTSEVMTVDYVSGSSSKLAEITFLTDTEPTLAIGFDYNGDNLEKATWVIPNEPDWKIVMFAEYTPDGKYLRKVTYTTTDERATPDVESTSLFTFDYSDHRVAKYSKATPDGESYTSKADYKDDKLIRRTITRSVVGGDVITIEELEYDSSDRLRTVKTTTTAVSAMTTFSYNDDDRVATATTADDTYALSYDTDGRVTKIIRTTGSDTWVTAYKYDDGEVDVLAFTPAIEWGGLFDLEGQVMELGTTSSFLTSGFLLQ